MTRKNVHLGVIASALVALAIFVPDAAATTQTPPPPAQPWKKKCDYGVVGGEGCVVTVEMRYDPTPDPDLCPGMNQYCLLLKVTCPANNPPGDPGEECSEEFCEMCSNSNAEISIACDGLTFKVKPKDQKNWGSVQSDCGNAGASAQ